MKEDQEGGKRKAGARGVRGGRGGEEIRSKMPVNAKARRALAFWTCIC